MQKAQLSSAQEEIITRLFRKEGLRIYVEDCLEDGLTAGLILLGKQNQISPKSSLTEFLIFSSKSGAISR